MANPATADVWPLVAAARLWVWLCSLAALLWLGGAVAVAGPFPFLLAITIVMIAAAGLLDAANFRVPNALTYPAILLGIVCGSVAGSALGPAAMATALGSAGAAQHVLGAGVWFAVCLPAWLLRWIGGGDLKLLTALGALLGLEASFQVVLWALPVAMLYALVNFLAGGGLNFATSAAARQALAGIGVRLDEPIDPDVARAKVPLAVPLVAGLLLALRFRTTWLDWALS